MSELDLSVICVGRIDNYEGDSTGRLIRSVSTNCDLLNKSGLNFEYIIGEWLPLSKPFYYHEQTKHLFDNYPQLREIILHKSVAEKEGFHPTKFMEYSIN